MTLGKPPRLHPRPHVTEQHPATPMPSPSSRLVWKEKQCFVENVHGLLFSKRASRPPLTSDGIRGLCGLTVAHPCTFSPTSVWKALSLGFLSPPLFSPTIWHPGSFHAADVAGLGSLHGAAPCFERRRPLFIGNGCHRKWLPPWGSGSGAFGGL